MLDACGVLGAQLVRLARTRATAERMTDPRVRRLFVEAACAVGLERQPELLRSPRLAILLGARAVPTCFCQSPPRTWSDERLLAVFVHETAHIRRRDWALHTRTKSNCVTKPP